MIESISKGITSIITLVIAIPLVAFMGGVGLFLYQIGDTWSSQNNDSFINSIKFACMTAIGFPLLLLAIVVGIPFAIRLFGEIDEGQAARQQLLGNDLRVIPQKRLSLKDMGAKLLNSPSVPENRLLITDSSPRYYPLPSDESKFRNIEGTQRPW